MWDQFACSIGMDMIVYGLLTDVNTFFLENPDNLCRKPTFFDYHLLYSPPQFIWLAMVAFKTMFARIALCLRNTPNVFAILFGISFNLSTYCWFWYSNLVGDTSFTPFPFETKINFVSLCLISWFDICNTKLINLWETSVSFFYFCIAVGRSLGLRAPAAWQSRGVFHIIKLYYIRKTLRFYLDSSIKEHKRTKERA